LQVRPNSSLLHRAAGDWWLLGVFDVTRKPEHAEKAIDYYRRAVDLYPNSGMCHAKLALAYIAAGREEDFRKSADKALRLDDLTPHKDKKLPRELRDELPRTQDDSS